MLYVKSNKCLQHLRYKGYEEFLPLYKVRATKGAVEKQKPLFPDTFSTVSARRQWIDHHYAREIEELKKIVASGFQSEPWKLLTIGEMVLLEEGPLAGRGWHPDLGSRPAGRQDSSPHGAGSVIYLR